MNIQEQIAQAKMLRKQVPRRDQAIFKLDSSRKSVEEMVNDSNYDRLPELIPIRHWRMSTSPFAFYRGTANIMAYDLYQLPHTGLKVQSIGDCHLANFGGFATPERTLVFDANDFDETHPATWEWDLKRLATSFILAAVQNNIKEAVAEDIVFTLVQSYQKHMDAFREVSMLDLWYMKFDFISLRDHAKVGATKALLDKIILAVQKKTHEKVFYKITRQVLDSFQIMDQPPLVYHPYDIDKIRDEINAFWDGYLSTLQPNRRFLLSRYQIVDVALKVVGVGSVGTRCYVVLLMNEKDEPLFIQVKEARPSVLEAYTDKSPYEHQGERVVEGQRLVQAASDIFLGWSTGPLGRQYYFRQLKDMKIAPEIELFDAELFDSYARLCGQVLARVHAKTGRAEIINAYMGSGDRLNEAITAFAVAYSKQTNADFDQFTRAIKSGKLSVQKED